MTRSITRWTTALAAAAVLAVPATGLAQTGTTGTQHDAQPAAQVDQEAARRHLSEARDILSQLTQLPAAAQLTGDARTQVSQLITNFNTLITAQTNWRESFDKVEANLNALLGPETADEPSRATTTTGATTGTAGAVGTSGTAAATVNLDATIRAKLVELRQKLNAFEQAAAGASVSAETPTATSATSGTMTSGTEQQSAQQPGQKTEAMGHSEALRHIEAIEAILNRASGGSTTGTGAASSGTTGTSGTATTAASPLTLDRAQLDQLKMHLAELRKLIDQVEKK